MQRVGEAQRLAAMDLRSKEASGKKRGAGSKRMRDDVEEEGVDTDVQRMMKQASKKKMSGKRK